MAIDSAKVCQMLDSGWELHLFKNQMGGYSVRMRHANKDHQNATAKRLHAQIDPELRDMILLEDMLITDGLDPLAVLTHAAYKAQGEFYCKVKGGE